MRKKPSLTVIGATSPATEIKPPRSLGRAGADLWRRITQNYDIHDEGGRELLAQACAAADRAAELQALIDKDGAVIMTRTGPREHPGMKAELAQRAFITRTLQRLGLNWEPLHSGPGRPSGS
jgi:hypothetical protein